jgi:hypothetical protein
VSFETKEVTLRALKSEMVNIPAKSAGEISE